MKQLVLMSGVASCNVALASLKPQAGQTRRCLVCTSLSDLDNWSKIHGCPTQLKWQIWCLSFVFRQTKTDKGIWRMHACPCVKAFIVNTRYQGVHSALASSAAPLQREDTCVLLCQLKKWEWSIITNKGVVPSFTLASSCRAWIKYACTSGFNNITGWGQNENVFSFTCRHVKRWCSRQRMLDLLAPWWLAGNGSEQRLLPWTALRTGLHPLIRRGRRHFCTSESNKLYKYERIHSNYTAIYSTSPPHHCLSWLVFPNNQPASNLRRLASN